MSVKILIAEDDFFSRKYLKDLLEFEKFSVLAAEDGVQAYDLFLKENPDIVITDIEMPNMNGIRLLDKIRQKKSDVIVVITTAFGSEEYAIEALRLGANNFIKKPIDDKEIVRLLHKYSDIIIPKKQKKDIFNILEQRIKFEFKTNLDAISYIVEIITKGYIDKFSDDEKVNIELGLLELLTNAVEHGNLEISFEEKNIALEQNRLNELYQQRINNPVYAERKILVTFEHKNNEYSWIIEDEGKGFDYSALPDPTIDGNLLGLSGRGIFISKFLFDKLEYSGRGNVVKAVKFSK